MQTYNKIYIYTYIHIEIVLYISGTRSNCKLYFSYCYYIHTTNSEKYRYNICIYLIYYYADQLISTTTDKNYTKRTASAAASMAVPAATSTPAPPPIFVNITQGKTEYTATIIDSTVLAVFQRKKDEKSRNEYLSILDNDTKLLIKWHSTDGKESVEASSVKFIYDKEDEGSELCSSKQRC